MKVYTIVVGKLPNCTYVIENDGAAILIDPAWDLEKIYEILETQKLTPKAALFTHGHYDHLTNASKLLEHFNIPAYIEQADEEMSGLPVKYLKTFKGDQEKEIAGLKIKFLHTPGHSPGSTCYYTEGLLFSGDTLFPGAVGRTDLPGSDNAQMQRSLERLSKLPPDTIVYSGHPYGSDGGAATTIGKEVKTNPFMRLALEDPKAFDEML
ncbi:MAG: MBL fold metallo-hydrolase [Elusimicrobiota bacterium]|jgi:glyoxylase-like metal-dependent hydrolase (beta-lactamase superfamily II)|nr:MBL fold metallo-hydrolase [Elusimicrobiota bacterium]